MSFLVFNLLYVKFLCDYLNFFSKKSSKRSLIDKSHKPLAKHPNVHSHRYRN